MSILGESQNALENETRVSISMLLGLERYSFDKHQNFGLLPRRHGFRANFSYMFGKL